MNVKLGEKIKELRNAKKMTQSELADRVGVTVSTISSYEVSDRQPSYDVLTKMSYLFNVTTDYLLGLDNKNKDTLNVEGLTVNQRTMINQLIIDYKLLNEYTDNNKNKDNKEKK